MSAHLEPLEAEPNLVPSPQATTSAILGASSNGWSPLRSAKRPTPAALLEHAAHEEATARPLFENRKANLGALKSHGLVSSSPFKNGSGSPAAHREPPLLPSPVGSPTRRNGAAAASRTAAAAAAPGIGLGIGASSSGLASPTKIPAPRSQGSGFMPTPRKTSAERAAAAGILHTYHIGERLSDAENDYGLPSSTSSSSSPRKSKGIEALQRANYVSNSPFRQKLPRSGSNSSDAGSSAAPPLLPNNAWSQSAAASAASAAAAAAAATSASPTRPRTPPNEGRIRNADDVFSTPDSIPRRRGAASAAVTDADPTPRAGNAATSSPSSRGLLVSNRLHGPRTMEQPSPADLAAIKRERRKTVTFDEVLDVQEFEKDSSFERESVRSEASTASFVEQHHGIAPQQGETQLHHQANLATQGSSATMLVADDDDEGGDEEMMWRQPDSASRQLDRMMGGASSSGGGALGISPNLSEATTEDMDFTTHSTTDDEDMDEDEDSRELSSAGEGQRSPPRQVHSLPPSASDQSLFEKSYATADGGNLSVLGADRSMLGGGGDESFELERDVSVLSGMHRVDSMVDELLHGSFLGNPSDRDMESFKGPLPLPVEEAPRRRAGPVQTTTTLPIAQSVHASIHDVKELEDGSTSPTKRKPLPTLPPTGPSLNAPSGLPSLPDWSPLMQTDAALPEQDEDEVERALGGAPAPASTAAALKPTSQTSTAPAVAAPRTRPHISRDAVLERVAREKKAAAAAAAAAAQSDNNNNLPSARSEILPRASMPAQRTPSGPQTGAQQPSPPTGARPSAPVAPIAPTAPTAARAPSAVQGGPIASEAESPLERLGAEVAAEQAQAAKLSASTNVNVPPTPKTPEADWFRGGSPEAEEKKEREEKEDVAMKNLSAPASTAPPRAPSPSLLGAAPAPVTPAQQAEAIIARRRSKNGKPQRKRSLSTGDALGSETRRKLESERAQEKAEQERALAKESFSYAHVSAAPLDIEDGRRMLQASVQRAIDGEGEVGFGNGIEREISRIYKQSDLKYKINDRGTFRGVDGDKVSHSTAAGDVDSGKAWRKLRRPSDMNEYAREMREYRANENPKRATGKVFVLIDSFTPSELPVPSRPTNFYCVLDNGLHVVKTATAPLRPGGVASKLGQEFELIQHKNLEFSLTLVVQRDQHLMEPRQPAESIMSASTSAAASSGGGAKSSLSRGVGRFFGSPRKNKTASLFGSSSHHASSSVLQPPVEPMLAYVNQGGAFGRSHIVFERVAEQCLGRAHTVDLPVVGVRDGVPGAPGSSRAAGYTQTLGRIRGTLRLRLFYLPPMPSVPRQMLPESMSDCVTGMQNAQWHANASAKPWMEGVLTQLGGDCTSWRRRKVKLQGAHLVGYNEITNKPTVKIDLSKVVSVDDASSRVKRSASGSTMPGGDGGKGNSAPASAMALLEEGEPEEAFELERSFRLTFADGERIRFFADTEAQKLGWIECFQKVVKNVVPPNPMWGQVMLEMMRSPNSARQAQQDKEKPLPLPTSSSASRLAAAPGSIGRAMREGKSSSEALKEAEEPPTTPQRAAQQPRPMSEMRPHGPGARKAVNLA